MPGEFIGYKDEMKKIEEAIMHFESGLAQNIAIISGPYSGKTTLMDTLYYKFPLKSARIRITADRKEHEGYQKVLNITREKIVFIDDCHLLYQRRVDGFEILEGLMDHIATHPQCLFITSWNVYSWNYLNQVLHIEKHFQTQIRLPAFESEEVRSVLMAPYSVGEIIFEKGDKNTIESLLEFKKYPLSIKNIDKTINIPLIRLNISLLVSLMKKRLQLEKEEKEITTEDLAFIRIADISSGNILLAQIIWNKSLQNSTIKVDEIYTPSFELELDYDTTFVGFLILSMGRISKDGLESSLGEEIDVTRSLAILRKSELIDMREGICYIRPEAVRYIGSLARDARMT